jgi:hypothetical protein
VLIISPPLVENQFCRTVSLDSTSLDVVGLQGSNDIVMGGSALEVKERTKEDKDFHKRVSIEISIFDWLFLRLSIYP